jgi:hypothetical protein
VLQPPITISGPCARRPPDRHSLTRCPSTTFRSARNRFTEVDGVRGRRSAGCDRNGSNNACRCGPQAGCWQNGSLTRSMGHFGLLSWLYTAERGSRRPKLVGQTRSNAILQQPPGVPKSTRSPTGADELGRRAGRNISSRGANVPRFPRRSVRAGPCPALPCAWRTWTATATPTSSGRSRKPGGVLQHRAEAEQRHLLGPGRPATARDPPWLPDVRRSVFFV